MKDRVDLIAGAPTILAVRGNMVTVALPWYIQNRRYFSDATFLRQRLSPGCERRSPYRVDLLKHAAAQLALITSPLALLSWTYAP